MWAFVRTGMWKLAQDLGVVVVVGCPWYGLSPFLQIKKDSASSPKLAPTA